ncbi:hypothetical protein KKF91_04125 [Myxococcota bacterium]|nr:hypothetical protein [Myxococcota bacterium]MBU1429732.1 hypothetical protein [Myxococcota bacterium]MBU1897755.1 hypothetical protein [Myxococcota bacterium]
MRFGWRRAAWVWGVWGGLLSGCVIPMPIEAEPIEENNPPFYLPGAAQPDPGRFVRYDPQEDGPTLTLSVRPIADANPLDRFFYRWFTNYDPDSPVASRIVQEGPPQGLPPERGEAGVEMTLYPCEETAFVGPIQRVEVIVADRPFLSADEAPAASPNPNQALSEEARAFRIVWFLEFDREEACNSAL